MNNNRNLSFPLTKRETIWGFAYLIFQFLFLPSLLTLANTFLPEPLDMTQLNFVFYGMNFLATILIFRGFLGKNFDQIGRHPIYFLQVVILGLAGYFALNTLSGILITMIDPQFVNANDAAIGEMVDSDLFLMAVGTVALVPPAEECLFRGLIFRNLYGKSRILAYIVSIVAFSAIHLISYIGILTPTELLVSFLQYIPAGVCLAWSYTKADTIFAPILIHAIVNAIGISAMR